METGPLHTTLQEFGRAVSLFAAYASSEMQGPFTAQLQQKFSFCCLCICFFLSYSPFLPGITVYLLYLIYRALFLEELSVVGIKHLTNSLQAAGEDEVNDQQWVLFVFFLVGWSASARVRPAATAIANRSASACIWNGRWTRTSHF